MYRILITCVGGHFSYDVVNALKKTPDFSSYILGVDVNKNIDKWFLDKFEIVPRADVSVKIYINKLLSICKKYKINIVIPCSENETIAISKHENLFRKKKILTSISSYNTVMNINDKAKLYETLKKNNVDICKWKKVDSFEEADLAISDFIYSSSKILLKPRFSSGSRGILLIDEKINSYKPFLPDRFCGTGSWKAIQNELTTRNTSLDRYLMMPFFSGKTYDVDCIAQNGKLVTAVPRLRLYKNPFSPTNQGCVIKNDKKIIAYCKKIIEVFKINGACDFDIVIRDDNKPQLLDASCRFSGSVSASINAGINIPSQLIKVLKSKKIKKYKLQDGLKLFPTQKFVKATI